MLLLSLPYSQNNASSLKAKSRGREIPDLGGLRTCVFVEECGRDFFFQSLGELPSPLKWRFAVSILTRPLVKIL